MVIETQVKCKDFCAVTDEHFYKDNDTVFMDKVFETNDFSLGKLLGETRNSLQKT